LVRQAKIEGGGSAARVDKVSGGRRRPAQTAGRIRKSKIWRKTNLGAGGSNLGNLSSQCKRELLEEEIPEGRGRF